TRSGCAITGSDSAGSEVEAGVEAGGRSNDRPSSASLVSVGARPSASCAGSPGGSRSRAPKARAGPDGDGPQLIPKVGGALDANDGALLGATGGVTLGVKGGVYDGPTIGGAATIGGAGANAAGATAGAAGPVSVAVVEALAACFASLARSALRSR